jgi:cytoskeleton protein RodZ
MTEAAIGLASGAGALLREERLRQGLALDALAAAMKIPPARLDALESGRYAELPDATFTRALAQAVCRHLKIDAPPILALLPAGATARLDRVDAGLNAPFRDRPGRGGEISDSGLLSRPVRWLALTLLLAAAVLMIPRRFGDEVVAAWHWVAGSLPGAAERNSPALASATDPPSPAVPTVSSPESAASAASDAATVATASPNAAAPSADLPGPSASTSILVSTAPAVPIASPAVPGLSAPAVSTAAASALPVSALAGRSMAASTTLAQPASAAPPISATAYKVPASLNTGDTAPAMATLRAAGVSWVEVRDAAGKVLLSRTLQTGDSADVVGPLPLKVTIGNASVTQLSLRGRPVDLGPAIRDNVARIELQ